jgi:hypothetical protein
MYIQMEAKIIKKKIKLIKMLTHRYQYLHFLIISNLVYHSNGILKLYQKDKIFNKIELIFMYKRYIILSKLFI